MTSGGEVRKEKVEGSCEMSEVFEMAENYFWKLSLAKMNFFVF